MPVLRSVIFQDYPNTVFITTSGILSIFALNPVPAPISIILTLTTILVYSRILLPAPHAFRNSFLLWIAIAIGGSLSRFSASLHALSTPGMSILVLFALSSITSFITLSTVYIDTRICKRLPSAWSQITLFPALWATVWFGVSFVSPIGRLSAWSPMQATGPYNWMIQLVGPASHDWIIAAWAVVCFEAIGAWFIGSDEEPLIQHNDHTLQQPSLIFHGKSSLLLAALLVTLAVPSFIVTDFPLPVLYPDVTPLSVGCILPPYQRYKHYALTLDDYISENNKLQSSAKILLWPEGAVTFNTEAEREEGLAKVRKAVKASSTFVGVSFEETFKDPNGSHSRSSSKRTGLAIVSKASTSPHLIYYKRHLVPIAESFSLSHSTIPPSLITLELTHPHDVNKTDWAPAPNYTRPIPLTASICLDFSDPLPFANLDSRPALILAPARTWDVSVGHALWQQAKQRAEELGSLVLWCDGGDGGVSGVAGQGYSDFTQVGAGSWVRNIGVQYPFNERRTPYAYFGNFTLLLFWSWVLGSSFGGQLTFTYALPDKNSKIIKKIRSGIQHTQDYFKPPRAENGVNLLD